MADTPTEPTPNLNNQTSGSRNSKTTLYAVLAIVIIAALAFAVVRVRQNENNNIRSTSTTGAKKEVNVTSEEEKVLKAQVEDYRAQIKNLRDSASPEDRFSLYSKLASAEYKLGEYDNAIADLNKIVGENQTNHRIWTLYTNIYWDMKNFPKAREASKQALDIDKENPQSWLAYIELQEDQSKENINKLYLEALTKTDTYIDVVTAYARFLEKVGDKPAAIAQWQKAATILPDQKAFYDSQVARLQSQP